MNNRKREWYRRNREEYKKGHDSPRGCDWPMHEGDQAPKWLQQRIADVWRAEPHLTISELRERFTLSEHQIKTALKATGMADEYRKAHPLSANLTNWWIVEFGKRCDAFALRRRGGVPPLPRTPGRLNNATGGK